MTVINIGRSVPLGSTITDVGVNFCLVATNAALVEILIFEENYSTKPISIFTLDKRYQSGPYWRAEIEGLGEGTIYAYRIHQKRDGLNKDYSKKILIDPCSRGITGWETYKRDKSTDESDNMNCCLKSVVCDRKTFNFKEFPRPGHSWEELIIYELHIGAFTEKIESSELKKNESCFQKFVKKIPYLKNLGITTIELLPVFCFDPKDAPNGLDNFWGYSPINWFTPHFEYFNEHSPKQIRQEFKRFVEECHKHNIEVILDVVYNHTSEGNSNGPVLSWKGIDENLYYFIDKNKFQDVSGCGNTIAANRSLVRRLIIDSLKCWVNEFGIDGFRFDLGIALTRGENLIPLDNPPLFEDIESDPDLTEIKLISEPWDCGGLYKIKDFPSKTTFTWNGHFRDDVRRFWKGEENTAWDMSDKIQGSPSIYDLDEMNTNTINFITSHDGFTLKDLVSFNFKHNFANREKNKDGENNNNSFNYGVEGPTSNKKINALRLQQQKNLLLSLFISKGVPMMLMGDERGRSQGGNNNTWCQNNSLGWMNWEETIQDLELFNYVKQLIFIRKKLIYLINPLLSKESLNDKNSIEYQWHGTTLEKPDWGSWSHTIAFSINKDKNPLIWIGLNAYSKNINFSIPTSKSNWIKVVDTSVNFSLKHKPIKDKFIEINALSSVLLLKNEVFENVFQTN